MGRGTTGLLLATELVYTVDNKDYKYSLLTDIDPVLSLQQFRSLSIDQINDRASRLEEKIGACGAYTRINEPFKDDIITYIGTDQGLGMINLLNWDPIQVSGIPIIDSSSIISMARYDRSTIYLGTVNGIKVYDQDNEVINNTSITSGSIRYTIMGSDGYCYMCGDELYAAKDGIITTIDPRRWRSPSKGSDGWVYFGSADSPNGKGIIRVRDGIIMPTNVNNIDVNSSGTSNYNGETYMSSQYHGIYSIIDGNGIKTSIQLLDSQSIVALGDKVFFAPNLEGVYMYTIGTKKLELIYQQRVTYQAGALVINNKAYMFGRSGIIELDVNGNYNVLTTQGSFEWAVERQAGEILFGTAPPLTADNGVYRYDGQSFERIVKANVWTYAAVL